MIKLEHKKIGNYIMLTNKKVAQLKHSTVFMGLNVQNKKKVLIKVISRAQYESNDVLMNSFNFEYNTMKMLNEENILKAIELIITEKNLYLVLEEPQGESFKKTLTKNGPIKEKQLRTYLKKLRSTFATLQKNKIIHGNINSKSVLIHHSQIKLGYPSYVKTIEVLKTNSMVDSDFSLGQNCDKQRDYCYLPPELLSHGMISLKHDIWSFGIVMYEAIFGCLPWNLSCCGSPSDMSAFIANKKIKFPKDSAISKEMKHFLIGCLETDPTNRFAWEDVLQHPVFNKDVENFGQEHNDEEEVSHEETMPFEFYGLKREAKSNSTITQ